MRIWFKATDKAGLRLPWAFIRRDIAKAWFVPPWVVDGLSEPDDIANEVRIELAIRRIESEHERSAAARQMTS